MIFYRRLVSIIIDYRWENMILENLVFCEVFFVIFGEKEREWNIILYMDIF